MGDAGEIRAGVQFDGRRVGRSFGALFWRLGRKNLRRGEMWRRKIKRSWMTRDLGRREPKTPVELSPQEQEQWDKVE